MPSNQNAFMAGTFCSGTDCVITVIQTFLKAAGQVLNLSDDALPALQHLFSCEKERSKQKFLQQFFPDMRAIHSDALEPIEEQAGFVSAGFPCDDASALHPQSSSKKHRLCVAEARACFAAREVFASACWLDDRKI